MQAYITIALFTFLTLFIAVLFLYVHTLRNIKSHEKVRNDFMAMMIHELRSPLAVIRSSADLILRQEDKLSHEQRNELLKQIEDSSVELMSIVNDLLDVSKIEAGRIEIIKTKHNLGMILKQEVERYKNLAHEKGLTLALDLDPTVDGILCDKEKLQEVMNNLLSNAIKYTPEGSVIVATKNIGERVQVSVSDTGNGVPTDDKKILFHKYRRALQASKSKNEGTGLGLVIVKGIVEAHGGKIWIEDNKPKGAKFIFTLPKT